LAWSKITGAPSFLTSFTETDPTVPAHVKAITTTNISNWNTAFGWGNHANLYPLLSSSYANPSWIDSLAWSKITGAPSFLTSFTETDPTVGSHIKAITTTNISNWNTAFGWGNHANLYPLLSSSYANPSWIDSLAWSKITGAPSFLTSFTETDPTVPAHVKAITTTNISNWNTAFGWGNHANLYPLLSSSYANPSWIDSLAWSKITGAPSFLTSFTETDPTVPNHVKVITVGDLNSWNAKATASGTTNKIAKFTGTASLGNSNITDNGTIVTIGTTSAIGQLSVEGAVWASANSSAVAYYMAGGAAIRAFGTMYLDSYDGEMIFRVGGGFTTALNLKSSGQARLNTYTSSSSWSGTAAGLLGFDSSGNVLTYEAVRTNAQNDARYLQSIGGHSHVIGDITSLQGALDGKSNNGHGHAISEVSGLSSALGDRPTWGDVYTRTQLNTSGGGGIVHWANVSNKPSTFPPEYHTHSISEVIGLWAELGSFYTTTQLNTNGGGGQVHWGNITNKPDFSYNGHTHTISQITGLQGALDGKSNNGHGHGIGEISGLQSALDGKSNTNHNHDDLYWRKGDLSNAGSGVAVHWGNITNTPGFITTENDPYGVSSSWFSVSGSTVTHSIARRNSTNSTASFEIPWSDNPHRITGIGVSMDSSTVIRVAIYTNGGGTHQATCNIYPGS
jgi:hypothetical protein